MRPGWDSDADMDVAGPMARTAEDLTLAFDLLATADHYAAPAWKVNCPADNRKLLNQFRVAVKLDDQVAPIDESYMNKLENFAKEIKAAGAMVQFNTEPDLDTQTHFDLYMTLLGCATSVGLTETEIETMRTTPTAALNPKVRAMLDKRLDGVIMSHSEWQVTHNERRKTRKVFDDFFENYDILLCPVTASSAFPADKLTNKFTRFIPVNGEPFPEATQLFWAGYSGVVGLPSSVGPMGLVNGLPMGYQAIAGYGRDRTALAFTEAVSRELGGFIEPPSYR